MADSNIFLFTEVEKCFISIIANCHPMKVLYHLLTCGEHRNPAVKTQVCKGMIAIFAKLQKEIFLFKEYNRLLKLLGTLTRDSNPEVRTSSKETVKILSELSDQPDLITKAINQSGNAGTLTSSTLKLAGSVLRLQEQAGISGPDKITKKADIKVKRLTNNKFSNIGDPTSLKDLNRTEEIAKDTPPMQLRAQNALIQRAPPSDINEGEVASPKLSQSPLYIVQRNDLMQRNRKPAHVARNYPELDSLPELMKDLESEGSFN